MSTSAAKIAIPYAEAAFAQALETKSFDLWCAMLAKASVIAADKQFHQLVFNPRISNTDVAGLLFDLVKESLSDDIKRFVELLIDYDRLLALPKIAEHFSALVDKHNNTQKVEVVASCELTAAQKEKLIAALEKRLSSKVELHCHVDKDLLAGAIIRIGDTVVDGSMRGRIAQLEQELV